MADTTRILAPMAFVGRERELARLAAGLERAASRQPARIALTGPAGIGISRLLTELQARLADLPDVVVLRAAAYEPQEGVPYAPLRAALGPSLESLDDERLADVVAAAGLEATALVPSIAERVRHLGLIPPDPMRSSPDQQASRLLEAVIGMLTRLAGDGVVVLALEDLHHADPGTRKFVETMLRERLVLLERRRRAIETFEDVEVVAVVGREPLTDEVERILAHASPITFTTTRLRRRPSNSA